MDQYVRLKDGSEVPILGSVRTPALPKVPEETPKRIRVSNKIRVARAVKLPPESQTWITVVCERRGPILVEPRSEFGLRRCISVAN